jgi:hypothetical protein
MARRFLVEAKAMSRLVSPHAIKVIAFDSTPEGALYLVMEFLEGCSLREHRKAARGGARRHRSTSSRPRPRSP